MHKKGQLHNIQLEYKGMEFGSRKELDRYLELKKMEEKGFISGLQRNVTYELVPTQKATGSVRKETKAVYVADFVYRDSRGNEVVEDVKYSEDPAYILKRKLMRHVYGISIKEIR